MTDAPVRLLNSFCKSLFPKSEWLRRVAVVGYSQGEGNSLVTHMAALVAETLEIEVEWADFADPEQDFESASSVVVGIVRNHDHLTRAVRLSTAGHRVIAAVQIPALNEIVDFLHAAEGGGAAKVSPLSRVSFLASVAGYPSESDRVLVSHVMVDAGLQKALADAVPFLRATIALNAAVLERCHRSGLEPQNSPLPRMNRLLAARRLSDSPVARRIPTQREN
jgi:hypothetical protein